MTARTAHVVAKHPRAPVNNILYNSVTSSVEHDIRTLGFVRREKNKRGHPECFVISVFMKAV